MMNFLSDKQQKLIQFIKAEQQSPSHDLDHLERVLGYAHWLTKKYQGDWEVVGAAAILHDLARISPDFRGAASAHEGARVAQSFLSLAGYSSAEVQQITLVIGEHDQPDFHSQILESRILKDADYLDGFGARGILRSLMYAGETKGGNQEALQRLSVKTRQRLDGLEFIESKRLGWKLYRLIEVFLADLKNQPDLSEADYSGKFVILEGISGTGKDTQAEAISHYLDEKHQPYLVINHPTSELKDLWHQGKDFLTHPMSLVFLMVADRIRMTKEIIMPALKAGKIVISSRSSISAQAYQPHPDFDPAFYRYIFSFEPIPDAVLYLDLKPEAAFQRTGQRVNQGEEKDRGFYGQPQTSQYDWYQKILAFYPNVTKINADQPVEQVTQALVEQLRHLSTS